MTTPHVAILLGCGATSGGIDSFTGVNPGLHQVWNWNGSYVAEEGAVVLKGA